MNLGVAAVVFGVIFIGELPDKSMFASLVLGTKFKRTWVWYGAAAAFLTHVIIAVTAGHFISLLPKSVVEYIVAALFMLGAALLLFGKHGIEEEPSKDSASVKAEQTAKGFWKVFATAYTVIFLGEWGDITQIATANYAAKYHDPLSVGIGATLALWTVAGLALILGAKLLDHVPAKLVQRITALILLAFGILSLVSAIRH